MLGRGFTAWAGTSLNTDDAEAALVLRRAIFISGGRGRTEELDRQPHAVARGGCWVQQPERSEEHTSELQSLMRISYAVFCLKKNKQNTKQHYTHTHSN